MMGDDDNNKRQYSSCAHGVMIREEREGSLQIGACALINQTFNTVIHIIMCLISVYTAGVLKNLCLQYPHYRQEY